MTGWRALPDVWYQAESSQGLFHFLWSYSYVDHSSATQMSFQPAEIRLYLNSEAYGCNKYIATAVT